MKKSTFYWAAIVAVLLAALIGFVLPMLMSGKNDITPLIGVGLIVAVAIAAANFALAKLGLFTKETDK